MRVLASIIVVGFAFARIASIHADSPADFDSDSDVDGADFLAWQRGLGSTGAAATPANGNADNDDDVDAGDLAAWRAGFGAPAVRTPVGQYLGMDADELGTVRSRTPDGQPDHHIKLSGLDATRTITFIDIKAGSDADITPDWKKWSTDAGEESPTHPAGLWWWIKQTPRIAEGPTGTLDLWFSKAAPNQAFTEYRVYVYYSSTDLTDRDFIRVSAPALGLVGGTLNKATPSNDGRRYRPPRRENLTDGAAR